MSGTPPDRARFLPPIFSLTIFASATLLFLVQPMVAKMMLPLFGGAAAVWTTCLLFYQAVLLLGYLYAHVVSRRLSLRAQVIAHAALFLIVLLSLPIDLSHDAAPLGDGSPIPAVLARLATSVGPPFFALSATGTLLQSWFSRSGHRTSRDPYFLYAASNLGSMLALLGYPSLLEPNAGLVGQSRLWAIAFIGLAAAVAACGLLAVRSARAATGAPPEAGSGADRGSQGAGSATTAEPSAMGSLAGQRITWIVLAMIPCSLMMAATLHLTTDIAPVPLLWTVPLSLYLMAFILAFARLPARVFERAGMLAVPVALVPLFFLLSELRYTTVAAIVIHLGALFLISVACLGKLALLRPGPERLTEFYLWVSVGGVLGGVFNAILAPLVFDSLAEYPVILITAAVVLSALRIPSAGAPRRETIEARVRDIAAGALVGLLCYWFVTKHPLREIDLSSIGKLVGFPRWRITTVFTYMIPVVACLLLYALRRTVAFGVALAAVAVVCTYDNQRLRNIALMDRSFFGVLSVEDDLERGCRTLRSGTTPHGRQFLDAERKSRPIVFYHRNGPIGRVFAELSGPKRKEDVAVIGLGAGALAAYGEPGQRFTFYEIDPDVARIATDPRLFTFLSESKATVDIVLGDARLKLALAPKGRFGIIVVDAFSSDAIPIHLLTREAIALYLEKLAPGGVLALHISNRYLGLAGVVGALAADAGLASRSAFFEARDGCAPFATQWAILARDERDFGSLVESSFWTRIKVPPGTPFWTDDFSNILSIMNFN